MIKICKILFVMLIPLFTGFQWQAKAEVPFLLFDGNSKPKYTGIDLIIRSGSNAFMVASDDTNGTELWFSDGTSAGTRLVKDIVPGAQGPSFGSMVELGGKLLFIADDEVSGDELWVSDGTTAGTKIIQEFGPGATGSGIHGLANLSNIAIFLRVSVAGRFEVWRTDGSLSGTLLVRDLGVFDMCSTQPKPVAVGGRVIFCVSGPGNTQTVWRTDGTFANTVSVNSSGLGAVARFLPSGNRLFIDARDPLTFDRNLWTGDLVGPFVNLTPSSTGITFVTDFVSTPSGMIFAADTAQYGTELWTSDGTVAGTRLIVDLTPGATGTFLGDVVGFGNGAAFVGYNTNIGQTLFTTDGSANGTVALALGANTTPNFFPLAKVGNRLLFAATSVTNGTELWTTDGSVNGSSILSDFSPGPNSSAVLSLSPDSGSVWIVVRRSSGESILYESNGAVGNLRFIKDLTLPGTLSTNFSSVQFRMTGNRLIVLNNEFSQTALHFSGGTPGTTSLSSVIPEIFLADLNGQISFLGEPVTTSTASGSISLAGLVYRTDGTQQGTSPFAGISFGVVNSSSNIKTMSAGNNLVYNATDSSPFGLSLYGLADSGAVSNLGPVIIRNSNLRVGGVSYFSCLDNTFDEELCRTDGTVAGTYRIIDLNPFGSSEPKPVGAINSSILFVGDDGNSGRELWKTTGSLGNAALVKDIEPGFGESFLGDFIPFGSFIYFGAYSNGVGSIWRTDGTTAGTVPASAQILGFDAPRFVSVIHGKILFTNGNFPETLWSFDPGSGAVTSLAVSGSSVRDSSAVGPNGDFYFAGSNPQTGTELWVTDGTLAGTRIVKDIFPGADSSAPRSFAFGGLNQRLYFAASNLAAGRELWRTDGTENGTQLVFDLSPGSRSSSPDYLRTVGTNVVFSADDGFYGEELWGVSLTGDDCPDDPNKAAPGFCGCGISDIDTDGDTIPDCNDECRFDSTKAVPGVCGCGIADIDSDLDGSLNCLDACAFDPLKTISGACGCGVSDQDLNQNGTLDCQDPSLTAVPPSPTVKVRKNKVTVTAPVYPGAQYTFTLKGAKKSQGRPIIKRSSSNVVNFSKVKKGKWRLSYRFSLGVSVNQLSLESQRRVATVK